MKHGHHRHTISGHRFPIRGTDEGRLRDDHGYGLLHCEGPHRRGDHRLRRSGSAPVRDGRQSGHCAGSRERVVEDGVIKGLEVAMELAPGIRPAMFEKEN